MHQPTKQQAAPAPCGLSMDIGKVLNIGGISFFVIGAVLLLGYSWLHLGPAFKIAVGALVSAALVVGGNFLSNRHPQVKWFGHGLIGGGYALGYFVLYALQNIHAVKLIDNPCLDLCLLLALSFVAMQHALLKRSQIIAMLVSALATITISLNPVTMFSVASCAILAAALSYAICRQRWFGLYCLNAALSYSTYIFLTCQNIDFPADPQITLFIALSFLTVIWLANTLSTLALAESGERKDLLGTMTTVNATIFVLLAMHSIAGAFEGYRFIFLNAVGGFYLRTCRLFAKRRSDLCTLAKLIGLTLVTAAIPLEQVTNAVPIVYVLEVALLAYAGLKFNQKTLRLFAFVLAMYSWVWIAASVLPADVLITVGGITMEWKLVAGSLAIASYLFAMYCHRLPQFMAAQGKLEQANFPALYYLCGSLMALVVPIAVSSNALAVVVWPAAGLALIAAGFKFDDKSYRVTGLLFFLGVAFKLLIIDMAAASTMQRSLSFFLAGVAFLLGSSAYAWLGGRLGGRLDGKSEGDGANHVESAEVAA